MTFAGLYLNEFPSGKGKRQVSVEGGMWPRWSRDGREISFVSTDVAPSMMSVSVQTGPRLLLGSPVRLFGKDELPEIDWSRPGLRQYDVSPDRDRFLMVRSIADESSRENHLVLSMNWLAAHTGRRGQ